MKKALALILALIMLLSLAACNPATPTDPATPTEPPAPGADPTDPPAAEVKYKERFVIGHSGILDSLDLHDNNSGVSQVVYSMTHSTLVDYDYNNQVLVPDLAKSWEVDGLNITFHLNENVTFHNGEPCTAEDVIWTYTRAKDFSYRKNQTQYIESMTAPDDHTLVITLSAYDADFLQNLTSPNMGVMCKSAMEADPEKGGMVGTGPFILTEWNPDESVLLTRYEGYFGKMPNSKEMLIKKIPEASARVIALQNGEIDICYGVPAIEAATLADSKGCELLQIPGTKLVYLALNVSEGGNPACQDKRVRQALNYATKVEDIIIVMTEGYATAPNGVMPESMFGYDPDVISYSYDLDKAKALLAEAGYGENNPLEIKMVYKSNSFPGLYELLQAQWALAGVNLILESEDSTTTSDIVRTKVYDMYQTSWNWSTTSYGLNSLFKSGSGNNRTITSEAELDDMIVKATLEPDDAKRAAIISDVMNYVSDYAAMIPLYIDTVLAGIRDNVETHGITGVRTDFTYACATE